MVNPYLVECSHLSQKAGPPRDAATYFKDRLIQASLHAAR